MRNDNHVFLVQSKPGIWERVVFGSLKEMQDYSSAYNTDGYSEGYYDTLNPPKTKIEKGRGTEYPAVGTSFAEEMESLGFVYTSTGGGCDGYLLSDGEACVLVTRYDGQENCNAPNNYVQDCVVWYDNETCHEYNKPFETNVISLASPSELYRNAKKLLENLKA